MSSETRLSSRERMLYTIQHGKVDHVPMWNLWRSNNLPFRYTHQVERVEAVLELGLDDTFLLQPPLNKTEHFNAGRLTKIHQRVWQEQSTAERYPLLIKTYTTPLGVLRQVVRKTEDWPYGEQVRLFSDHNVSRSLEFPVSSLEDLDRLEFIFKASKNEGLEDFRTEAAHLRNQAQRLGVILEGGWSALGDAALWLLGTERLIFWQIDHPDWLERLLDIVLEWELGRLELLLDARVEVMVHSAWYESTNFWSPRTYRRFLKPRLKRLIDQTHQAGVHFSYIITSAWGPLTQDFLDLGIDSLMGVDPIQGQVNLVEIKASLGEKICLWGGINGAVTLGNGTPQSVRLETQRALEILAPGGGFVLYPVDQIVKETPWENVLEMIAAWREFSSYPYEQGGSPI